MISRTPRSTASRLVGALLACAVMVCASGANAMSTLTDWFKVSKETLNEWEATVLPQQTSQIRIKPKRGVVSQALRRVLVLYPRRSSAYDTAISTFLNVLFDKRLNVELTIVNYQNEDARGKQAIELAETNNFDLILSMGSESTAWLWTNYKGGRLPVVTVCSKDPVLLGQASSYDKGSGTNFAFTSLNMPIDAQMSYVMRLRPNLKNLAILVDANNVSAVQTQAVPAKDYLRARGIRVLDVAVKNPAKVKDEIAVQVRDAVTAMRKNDPDLSNSLFWITGSTLLFSEISTINQNAFRVPVLSTVTDVVQEGEDSAVLSVGISFESNAHLAAIYAADVMENRQKVGAIQVGVVSPPDVAISFRKARDIGMKIPFTLFESASIIYDNDGKLARSAGTIAAQGPAAPAN